jgi:hypothetical protein
MQKYIGCFVIIISGFITACAEDNGETYQCNGVMIESLNLCVNNSKYNVNLDSLENLLLTTTSIYDEKFEVSSDKLVHTYPIDIYFLDPVTYNDPESLGVAIASMGFNAYIDFEIHIDMEKEKCIYKVVLIHEWLHILWYLNEGIANVKATPEDQMHPDEIFDPFIGITRTIYMAFGGNLYDGCLR